MKAINRGQVDGFPPKSEVVTVYVEHDIDASLTETSVADFVWTDKQLMGESFVKVLQPTLVHLGCEIG